MATTTHDGDFTFPTAAASSSATVGFDSPPLWHLSPTSSPPHRDHHTTPCTSSNTPPINSDKNLNFHKHAHTTQYTKVNISTFSDKNLDFRDHARTTQYTSSDTSTFSHKNLDFHLHTHEKTNMKPITRSGKNLDLRDHEEKMDMLWEDFNEELTVMTNSDKPRVYPVTGHKGLLLSPKRRAVSTMNRSNSGKRIVKVLKTMFLLPSNHHQHVGGGLFRQQQSPASVKIKNHRSSW
ncbi:hypothetical protein LINGRAHAP2_LOCUS36359 [Linum grandiflorum]